MHDFGPGAGNAAAPDEPEPEDEVRVPGMEKISPEAAAAREKAAAEKKAKVDPDARGVTDERLRELKEKARAKIEERLVAKRKQRKLLRGGDKAKTRKFRKA